MEVRPLPAHLADEAVGLWRRTGLTRPWNDPEQDLRRAVAGSSSLVLAALDGDRLLGTVMVGEDGHRGWLYYLAVLPGEQRRGLGSLLVRAAERWLAEREVPKVQLMVRSDNATVAAFYQGLGYEPAQVAVLGRRLDG